MSKFNDSYERLYEYWSYGWAIDYNVEEQLDDWNTINEEYTKLSKALDKACIELVKLKECADCWEYEEHCPFRNRCKEGINYCYDTRCWKELLLKEDE